MWILAEAAQLSSSLSNWRRGGGERCGAVYKLSVSRPRAATALSEASSTGLADTICVPFLAARGIAFASEELSVPTHPPDFPITTHNITTVPATAEQRVVSQFYKQTKAPTCIVQDDCPESALRPVESGAL